MLHTRRLLAVAVCAITLATGAACDPLDVPPTAPQAGPPAGNNSADEAVARAALEELTVGTWGSMAGYTRDRFHTWSSQGHGCDTRDVVLTRDGKGLKTSTGCAILSGSWTSPYDGEKFSDPKDLDIDHMVPLANAWRTGAAAWTDDQREEFANDLTRPQLLAVSASSNRSKGDQDPSQWKPPTKAYWCTYAEHWISVKRYWVLTVTAAEKAALTDMLESC